jgi:hypothetical protein
MIYRYGDKKHGVRKDIHKSIQLLEKAIELGCLESIYELAIIYQFGSYECRLEKDFNKSFSLFFKRYSIDQEENSNIRLLFLMKNEQKHIVWKKEYHNFWKKPEILNEKIILLLLISKHKKDIENYLLKNIFLKGITFKIIQFLCHVQEFTSNN